MPYTAQNASSFVGTLSVNTHLGWSNVPYTNVAQVEAAANYIGIHTFRDTTDSMTVLNKVAADGFHLDLFSGGDLSTFLSNAHNLEAAHPGVLKGIEGPNEVNGWPVSYNGLTGYAGSAAYQQALYTGANADPLLAHVPVFNVTVSGVSAEGQLGDLSAYTDYGNVHIYYGGGQPAYGWSPNDSTWWWTNWLKAGQVSAPGKPVVVTETGATTWNGGVSESVQAKQILNSVMDGAKNGSPFTNIYELVDSRYDTAGTDSEGHFGLYRTDWTPKLAATALHNFTTILTDGSTTGAFTPGSLDYTISGVPQWGGQMLLQEQDGTYDLVVWAEPDIWNESSHTAITPPTTQITVNLASTQTVSIYDPMQGSTAVQSLGATNQVTVNVTDHPIIIELKGGATTTPTTTASSSPSASISGTSQGDVLAATTTAAEVHGGPGDDTISGAPVADYLRGDDGNDSIQGGAAFDDINGNMGNDTIHGGLGDDWVVGGKDNDALYGDGGSDIVFGNLGADTLDGGAGADLMRGGQGNDVLNGGDGADWLSGDRGDDTVTGGAGADIFHSFSGAGIDRVTDFHLAEGDRVQLDPGTHYTVSQSGADTLIDLGNGDQMILVGVSTTSLTGGWIFTA